MVLGDYLNDEQKRLFILTKLKPGAVIYRFCDFTKPPKIKYLLVLQVQTDTVVFVINSEINRFIQSKKCLRDAQIVIDQASHSFLDYDSYIDCTDIEQIDTACLVEEIMQDLNILKEPITAELKVKVIATILDSFTLSPSDIASLIASLSV